MSLLPIQITNEGVLIPKVYLDTSGELELVVTDDFIMVRPKHPNSTSVLAESESPSLDYDFIGIGHSRDPEASINAKEILSGEIKRDSGWSLE